LDAWEGCRPGLKGLMLSFGLLLGSARSLPSSMSS
jgi:hypothetical protein